MFDTEQMIAQDAMKRQQRGQAFAENLAEGAGELGVEAVIDGVAEGAVDMVDVASEVASGAIDAVGDVAEGAVEAVGGAVDVIGDAIAEGIANAAGGVLEGADDLPGLAIAGIIAGAIALIGGLVLLIYKLARSIVKR